MSHVLHCGDSLLGMAGLPDKSVDHTICDPPFASEIYERCRKNPARHTNSAGANTVSRGLIEMSRRKIGTADDIMVQAAEQIARVTRRWALVFCDAESVHLWRAQVEHSGMRYVRCGAWAKDGPMPQFSGDRPAQGFEACVIAHAGDRKLRWNGGGAPALWFYPLAKGDERPDHPCPKPLALMERLVADFTDAGELILDPFAGSGTTLVAAKRLGRNAIGWEKDPKFHAAAVRRIDAAREQFQLPRFPRPRQLQLEGPEKDDAA